MITDLNQIENEDDRKVYVLLREVLDKYFTDSVEFHKEKNHAYHECFNDELDKIRNSFNALKDKADGLEFLAEYHVERFIESFRALIILKEYIDNQSDSQEAKH